MKKMISFVLAIMMAASMSVNVFASTNLMNKGEGNYQVPVTGTYQSGSGTNGKTISVDILWGNMEFTYKEGVLGTWDTSDHSYKGGTAGSWSDGKGRIVLRNHSNTAVTAGFVFEPNSTENITATGTFYPNAGDQLSIINGTVSLELPTAVGTTRNDEDGNRDSTPQREIYFGISGTGISKNVTLGNIVVTIAAKAE